MVVELTNVGFFIYFPILKPEIQNLERSTPTYMDQPHLFTPDPSPTHSPICLTWFLQ